MFKNVYSLLYYIKSKFTNIKIHRKVFINKKTKFAGYNDIYSGNYYGSIIGKHTTISGHCDICNCYIGNYTSIGKNIRIIIGNHNYKNVSTSQFFNKNNENYSLLCDGYFSCVIGNDVWIGDNVLIKEGVKIGDGAVIGFGSVVTKDVEPYSIVAGNPAKIIKYRFEKNVIDNLLQIKWWDYDDEKIHRYYNILSGLPQKLIDDFNSYVGGGK